jgi:hypothetical protein
MLLMAGDSDMSEQLDAALRRGGLHPDRFGVRIL